MATPLPSSLSFSVTRKQPELVVPAKPIPREIKQLSDIDDQQGLRFHLPMIMFYKNNPLMEGIDPVSVIREALAKALVYYYPYAGRLIEGPNKKLMVNCTGEGVLFVEADADVKLEELGDTIYPPCLYWEELLHDVPGSGGIVACPLMLVQVTRLKCGGFTFAIRLNHTMSDGLGLVQLLNAVGEIAQGASTPSLLPMWRRSLLRSRRPPRITCTHPEYDHDEGEGEDDAMNHNNMVQRSFYFGPKEINAIKQHLPPHLQPRTSPFDMITACVWRSRTIALRVKPEELVRITFMINLRGTPGLNLPPGYYGNAVASPAAVSDAKTLCGNPLGYAVELVQKAKTKVNEEYVRSVTDVMVMRGRPRYKRQWNLVVADTSRVGLGEVNFGWGKTVYGGTVGTVAGIPICTSLYGRVRNGKGEEGVAVPMSLPGAVMERFQEEVKKMTQEEPVEDLSYLKTATTITSML